MKTTPLTTLQRAKLDDALTASAKRMAATIPVTIKLSESDLSFLKKESFERLEAAAKAERRRAKNPAAKALESLRCYTPEVLNKFLVECLVRNHVQMLVFASVEKLLASAGLSARKRSTNARKP